MPLLRVSSRNGHHRIAPNSTLPFDFIFLLSFALVAICRFHEQLFRLVHFILSSLAELKPRFTCQTVNKRRVDI